MNTLSSLKGNSKTIFLIAALILILNNIAAALNAFTEMAAEPATTAASQTRQASPA